MSHIGFIDLAYNLLTRYDRILPKGTIQQLLLGDGSHKKCDTPYQEMGGGRKRRMLIAQLDAGEDKGNKSGERPKKISPRSPRRWIISHMGKEGPGCPDSGHPLGLTGGHFMFRRAPMGLGCSNNNFIKISAYRAKPGTTSMLAPATEDHGSEEETYVGKAAEKAAGDGDITHSRRTMRNGPPPPLPKARARARHRKKKPTHVRLSSVTEAASSNTDSHHTEESDSTNRSQ